MAKVGKPAARYQNPKNQDRFAVQKDGWILWNMRFSPEAGCSKPYAGWKRWKRAKDHNPETACRVLEKAGLVLVQGAWLKEV